MKVKRWFYSVGAGGRGRRRRGGLGVGIHAQDADGPERQNKPRNQAVNWRSAGKRTKTASSSTSCLKKTQQPLARTLPSHMTVTECSSLIFQHRKWMKAFKLAAAAQRRLILLGPAFSTYVSTNELNKQSWDWWSNYAKLQVLTQQKCALYYWRSSVA